MEPSTSRSITKRLALGLFAVVAAASIALAFWTRHLVRLAELDYPELGQRVSADGIELHYVDRGSGRPIVLLHGAFGALEDYTATIFDPLTRHYRAVAFDRPGHGYSQRPKSEVCTPAVQARILHDAITKLGLQRPVIVGFSWSGALALAYGLEYPRDTSAIVTINGVTHPWPGMTNPIYTLTAIPLLGTWFTHTLVMPIGRYSARSRIALAFDPDPVPLLFMSSPVRLALRPASFAANAEDIRLLRDFVREESPRYGELSVPLVIVVGESDKIVTPWLHSHALHKEVPGSQLMAVPDAGHQLLYTHPKVILSAIERAAEMAEQREESMRATRAAAK
jgi:pimeloyl-ACP methyl ester carboxylesterase